MSISTLPLSYCTNVHPGRSLAEVVSGLDDYTVPVRENLGEPLAAGLWLAHPVIEELLATPDAIERFVAGLVGRNLGCFTLNAFPYGDFHSARVKQNVYIPDWADPSRLDYTSRCAQVLARLMPVGCEGSISTLPLGFKPFDYPPDFFDRAMAQLIELARRLDELHDETGKVVRLAIEPEPFCILETTDEAIAFFKRLYERAADADALERVRQSLGLCYDVCHQSVEFEDVTASIAAIDAAGIRINKVHITCAVELTNPAGNEPGRKALARYVEPRYLHQTFARTADDSVLREVDLSERLALEPPPEFLQADSWRVHFHVPVDAEQLGPLSTTRPDLRRALRAVANLTYAPHLEVETYTWEVLPDGNKTPLVDGLTRELLATRALLAEIAVKSTKH
ncbi:MAG: metabolite traffic protein EboE [Planctomycetaceae bacterium]